VVVADMPLLEVESNRAGSTCCKTCSEEQLHTTRAGFFIGDFRLTIFDPFAVALFLVLVLDNCGYFSNCLSFSHAAR